MAYHWIENGFAEKIEDVKVEPVKVNKKVSIIILVCNALDYFKKCFESVIKYTYNYELIIVDNGSNPQTKKYISDQQAKYGFTTVTNKKNMGFSYGCNQGIKVSTCDYICFLNSDTVVTKNWLAKLMEGLELENAGATGPSSCWIHGKQMIRSLADKRYRMTDKDIQAVSLDKGYEEFVYPDYLVGFCILVKKEVIDKIGGFAHKSFPIALGEDVDFSVRIARAGYRLYWIKDVYVHHFGNATLNEQKINFQKLSISNRPALIKLLNSDIVYIENDVEVNNIVSKKVNKIGFLTYQAIVSDNVASTRFRVTWPLKYMPASFASEDYDQLKKCDAVVFQTRMNTSDIEMAVKLKADGVKLIWDFTDPHWLKEYDRHAIHPIFYKIAELADIVTLPTEEEERTYRETFPKVQTQVLKDRLELSKFKKFKIHKEHKDFKICWHGSYGNIGSIDLAREDLERLGAEFDITLVYVFDKAGQYHVRPFRNIKIEKRLWSEEAVTCAMLDSDVSINPKYDNWKSYKSNNKTIMAWVCGVPCVERNFYNEIKKFLLSTELRNKEGKEKRKHVIENYDVRDTAKEWNSIVNGLIKQTQKIARPVKNSIAVYTSICGGYDDLREDQFIEDGVDYIAFLDRYVDSKTWEVKKIFRQFIDPSRQAKIYKVLFYQYLEHQYSIWMDGRMAIRVSPKELIEKYLKDADIALFNHFRRNDIYEEYLADVPKLHREGEPAYLLRMQKEKYLKEGFPKHSGLFECTIILRRNTQAIQKLMETWWSEISAYTVSDQCSFIYCVKKHGIKVNTIPGIVWDTPLFHKGEHKDINYQTRLKEYLRV